MSKNVLVLSGSYRKGGNSDTLCEEFAKGAIEAGNQVEKIDLRDKKINFCTGCYACKNTGICVQKDDMKEILDKLMSADVIVMGTPVYFYTMCGQMKTLIDRTVAIYPRLTDKDMYFMITAADGNKSNLLRTLEEFRGFMACYSGMTEKGVILGAGVWQIGDISRTPYEKEAYEMGKNL